MPEGDAPSSMLVAVVALAIAFGLVNGVHDAGNAIAAPVVTKALRPLSAVAIASLFHVLGALVVGTAVATTIGGIIGVTADQTMIVLGAAVTGALVWNVMTLWWGLPCSSGHCLVGALAGAALAEGGTGAVHWGGMAGLRPTGVFGSLIWLFLSTVLSVPLAAALIWIARHGLRRARRAVSGPVRRAEVATSAALAFAHGSNDAQKTMGILTLALLAGGRLSHFDVPIWVILVSAGVLTVGTCLGGWRVVHTLGRGIYQVTALDGLVSQVSATAIVLSASLLGAPVSTTDVVAPSIVGVGMGERWRRVRWAVVEQIALAWLVTLPVAGLLAAAALPIWRVMA